MKPLIVLLVSFLLTLVITKLVNGDWNYIFSGNAAMSVMLLFTSIGHFKYVDGMIMMMPEKMPAKKLLVYFTGLIEIAAAVGLLIPSFCNMTSWLLIIFFICILPANINAAIKKIDYAKATTEGRGPSYLWFRIPLQIFFIAWVYWFGIHQ